MMCTVSPPQMCSSHTCAFHVCTSLQGGKDSQDPLSLQVIFRKSVLYLVALLWKMICNLGDLMSLRHPVHALFMYAPLFYRHLLRVYIHIYIYICIYMYTYIHVYMSIFTNIYICICIYKIVIHTCVYIMYIYIHIYIYIHPYFRIYIYMNIFM